VGRIEGEADPVQGVHRHPIRPERKGDPPLADPGMGVHPRLPLRAQAVLVHPSPSRPLEEVRLHRGHEPEGGHPVQLLRGGEFEVLDPMPVQAAHPRGVGCGEGLLDRPVADGVDGELEPRFARLPPQAGKLSPLGEELSQALSVPVRRVERRGTGPD